MKIWRFLINTFSTPAYPIYFAGFSVLFYTSQHFSTVSLSDVLITLAVVVGTSLIVLGLLFFVKDRQKRSLIALVILEIMVSYGTIKAGILGSSYSESASRYNLPFYGTLLVALLLLLIIAKYSRVSHTLTGILTWSGLFLLISGSISIAQVPAKQKKLDSLLDRVIPTLDKTGQRPDIYYLVFDEYTGPTGLKKLYHYDDSGFLQDLKSRGFYTADKSTANYYGSLHALSSTLNLDYFNRLTGTVPDGTDGYALLQDSIENNSTVLALRRAGYKYYHLGSWWEHTRVNRNATQNLYVTPAFPPLPNFTYRYLTDATVLDTVVGEAFPEPNQKIVPYQLATTTKIAKEKGSPKFVFTHFLLPHKPVIYDKNCRMLSDDESLKATGVGEYLDQVTCTNRLALQTVDAILANSATPPIIILQSDEGQELAFPEPDDPGQWPKEALLEKFPTVSAFYFPDGQYNMLYPTITAVNTFRVVLSQYLGANLPLLPDKNFMFPDHYSLKGQTEVTSRVQKVMADN